MPLVVPGVNSAMEQKTEWYNKLKGKKFVEEGSEASAADANTFTEKDLPKDCRVIKPSHGITMDYRPDRLNVHLDENDVVRDVGFY